MADQIRAPIVQTPPQGWLGALGIKSGGQNPQWVNPGLSPVQDMEKYYRAGARTLLANPTVALVTGGGTVALYTVPQQKVCILESATGFSNPLGAVANAYAQFCITAPGGVEFWYGTPTAKALTGEALLPFLAGPLILSPGMSVVIFTIAPAAITATNIFTSVFGQEILA